MSEARFAIVPADAVTDTDLTATQLRVLLVIGTYLSKDDTAFPKQKTIADRLGIARETVNRAVKVLSDREYIQVHHQKRDDGGQRENQYTVKLDPCDRSVTPPVTSGDHTPCDHTGSHPRTPHKNATERKVKRATRLDKTWLPDDSLKAYALTKGVHESRLDDCIEDFVDYWTSEDASPKKDWPATWRGHCRRKFKQFSRAKEAFNGNRTRTYRPGKQLQSVDDSAFVRGLTEAADILDHAPLPGRDREEFHGARPYAASADERGGQLTLDVDGNVITSKLAS